MILGSDRWASCRQQVAAEIQRDWNRQKSEHPWNFPMDQTPVVNREQIAQEKYWRIEQLEVNMPKLSCIWSSTWIFILRYLSGVCKTLAPFTVCIKTDSWAPRQWPLGGLSHFGRKVAPACCSFIRGVGVTASKRGRYCARDFQWRSFGDTLMNMLII